MYELGYFADRGPYLAMKLVRGQTLAAMLSARKAATENLAGLLAVFEQVCQAIAYAHVRRVIHRDLKPGNIMVGEFGEVQVMDWGLAKILRSPAEARPTTAPQQAPSPIQTHRSKANDFASLAGCIIGTPAYMPPEQSWGDVDTIDQRADVFALGAILCEILTGLPPYVADSIDEVCRMSQLGDQADSRRRLADCGADVVLRELALQCLAKDASDRPSDAGMVAQQISAYLSSVEERLQHERLVAERQQLLVIEERKRRRLWVGLSTVGLLAISLAAVAAFVWQSNRADNRQRLAVTAEQLDADLSRAKSRLVSGDIPGAWLEWNRAATREGMDARTELRDARDQLKRDLDLTDKLDEIRLLRSANSGADLDTPREGYEKAFAQYGLSVMTDSVELLTMRINESLVKSSLFAALHDWAWVCHFKFHSDTDEEQRPKWQAQRDRLLLIAKQVNSNRQLDLLYDPANWDSRGRLDQLSMQLDTANESPDVVLVLGRMLPKELRETLWRSAQLKHPDDFWLNIALAQFLESKSPQDALEFHRAALAIRPDAVPVLVNFGVCLFGLQRLDEAFSTFERALKIDPECSYGLYEPWQCLAYTRKSRCGDRKLPSIASLEAGCTSLDESSPDSLHERQSRGSQECDPRSVTTRPKSGRTPQESGHVSGRRRRDRGGD